MGQMFSSFFSMLTRLFSAGEKAATALENIAIVGEETSGQWVDDSRAKRALAIEANKKLLKAK